VNDLSIYNCVRPLLAPGDVIAFGGTGFVSGAIEFLTHSAVSHVAVVFRQLDRGLKDRVRIAEATSLNSVSGVQFNYLSERLAEYPGRAWWLPLNPRTRRQLNIDTMLDYMDAQDGRPYDFKGIAAFLCRPIPGIGEIPWLHHGAAKAFFCSEYIVSGFKEGGLPIGIESDEVSPQTLCRLPLYDKQVQLIGKPLEIRPFNTIG